MALSRGGDNIKISGNNKVHLFMWTNYTYTGSMSGNFTNYDTYFIDNGNGTCNIVGTFTAINPSANGSYVNVLLPPNVQLTGFGNVNISGVNTGGSVYNYVSYGGASLSTLGSLNSNAQQFSCYSSNGSNQSPLDTYNFNCTMKFQYTNTILN